MTRKRYFNLLRAIFVEMSIQDNVKYNWKNVEKGFPKLRRYYEKEYSKYSYAELFKAFEPAAHRFGIGGY